MVLPFIPYPLRGNGGTIRYLPIIQYFSVRSRLDIIVIDDGHVDPEKIHAVRKHCGNLTVVRNPRAGDFGFLKKLYVAMHSLMPWTPSLDYVTYGGDMLVRDVSSACRGRHYDCLIWVAGYYAECLIPIMSNIRADRTVIDFIDSPSLWAERGGIHAGNLSLIGKYNLWKTRKWEGSLIRRTDASIYISDVDAASVPPEMGPVASRHVIPNGIVEQNYTGASHTGIPSPNIGFLGNMSYPPNIDAVHWLFEKVFLPIREKSKNLSLIIIGRNPADSVKDLGNRAGVTVTGTVEDIWPYVNSVDLFAFPLHIGAGMKNKVLEVMYAGKPVLTTRVGNEGINAVPGKDLLICRTPEEFQQEAIRLLEQVNERIKIGNSAREFVAGNYTWDRILKRYEELIDGKPRETSTGMRYRAAAWTQDHGR
jgi:glycosyltransferase involved in cell wall biosynthesis